MKIYLLSFNNSFVYDYVYILKSYWRDLSPRDNKQWLLSNSTNKGWLNSQNLFILSLKFLEVSLYGFCGSCHLVVLLSLFILWLRKKCKIPNYNMSMSQYHMLLHHKIILSTSLCLSGLNLFFFIYSIFWLMHVHRTDNHLITQLDLFLRVLAWFAISIYLYFNFHNSNWKIKLSFFLKLWLVLFLVTTGSFLAIDIIHNSKHGVVQTHVWVLDSATALCGLILNLASLFKKKSADTNPCNACNLIGDISLFANADFLSVLTFSWIAPLLSLGHKKILNLKDVPKFANLDSIKCVYPIFKHKLQSYTTTENKGMITNLNLAKALLSSIKELLL